MNNKTRIFEFLYKKSNDSYNINQISRLVGISVGSSFKILKEFEKDEYVTASKRNNAVLYQLNLTDKTKNAYESHEKEKNQKNKKKTKIICTISQSSSKPALIKKLVENGMNGVCIDFSGCDEKMALNMIKNIRENAGETPILMELKSNLEKSWIKFALKNDIDFIIAPAKSAEEVRRISRLIGYESIKQVIGSKIKIIVKLDKESAKNYKEIIEEAYGIVIDRGGFDNLENLPVLQKNIIEECNKHGKPAIISGNILNSVIDGKQLMQSEAHDLANAVFEGASCIMLKELGKNSVETVGTVSDIIKASEFGQIVNDLIDDNYDLTHFIGKTAAQLEKILRLDALLIITSGGYSARMISSRKLRCKTIAATPNKKIFRQLNLLWGIEPLHVEINSEDISNNEKKKVMLKAIKKGFIGKRDQVAIIASVFHSASKRTNLLEIHNVEEFLKYVESVQR